MPERTTRLVISRAPGEVILIGDAKIIIDAPCRVKLVIEAPLSVRIVRAELVKKDREAA